MKKGKLIVFSAPSGSGKTTLVKALLQKNLPLSFSISATSRKPRAGEIDGKDYYFLSSEDFKDKIDREEFVEFEEVYADQYYGTLKSELDRLWQLGKTPVLDIDVKGAINVQNVLGDNSLSIFIMPPSIEVLKERLMNRQTESAEAIQTRIDKAAYEMEYSKAFKAIVKNEVLEVACAEVAKLIENFINH